MSGQPRLVEGQLRVDPPASVSGWCRLPEQPRARAEIEILVDSRPVLAITARQVLQGIGDGMHGFSLTLPVALRGPATCVVEARERDTGIIFGRVVLFEDAIAQPIEDRLSALDRSQLRHTPAASLPDPATLLRRHFGSLGAELLDPAGAAAIGRERAALARRVARLPLSARPAVSVIMAAAGSIGSTLGWFTALHGLAGAIPTEVILADDGAQPRTALLPQACPGLRYARDPAGLTGHALNQLVLDARAPTICFLDQAAESGPWAWPAPDPGERHVHLGGSLARIADTPHASRRHDPHGFALYLPRATITDAGGFEPALPAAEAYADLALKCALLGAELTAWME
jgi:hypothetical protein